jgi:hypothetical protein
VALTVVEGAALVPRYLQPAKFRRGIAATLHPNLITIGASTAIPTAIAMLNMRQKLCP